MSRRIAALLAVVILATGGCGPAGSAGPTSGPTAQPSPTAVPTSQPTSAPTGPTTAPTAEPSTVPAEGSLVIADVPRAATSPEDAVRAAVALNAFGLDLYRAAGSVKGNLVVSPASVALALAMARAGARGETAAQMDAVLRSLGADDHAADINGLAAALAARNGTFKDAEGNNLQVTLRVANAPFGQRGMALQPSFLDALASRFGAGLRLVDYAADPEAARKVINGWVDQQTEHRIKELLAHGVITSSTRLALVNAIYLKAPWAIPFLPESTKKGAFHRPDGSTIEVPFMNGSTGFSYAAGTGWRAVELPYIGGSLALDIIVPEDLAAFEAALTPEQLASVTGAIKPARVDLSLPRFGIETSTDLARALSGLGMPLAFDAGQADFSGITTADRLFISAVIHQANIDVDEKGTTAAAATAVVMAETSGPGGFRPIVLRVDRPFLFVLRDLPSGAILFIGRVTDPSTKG